MGLFNAFLSGLIHSSVDFLIPGEAYRMLSFGPADLFGLLWPVLRAARCAQPPETVPPKEASSSTGPVHVLGVFQRSTRHMGL